MKYEDTYLEFINSLYPMDTGRNIRFGQNAEIVHAALGIAGESGELVDIIKKAMAYNTSVNTKHLLEEAGDLVHYVSRLLSLYGFTLSEAINANREKLQARYPHGYTNEAATARRDKK